MCHILLSANVSLGRAGERAAAERGVAAAARGRGRDKKGRRRKGGQGAEEAAGARGRGSSTQVRARAPRLRTLWGNVLGGADCLSRHRPRPVCWFACCCTSAAGREVCWLNLRASD